MQARRRIGLGLVASIAAHLAAAIGLLVAPDRGPGGREADDEDERDETTTEVELLDAPEPAPASEAGGTAGAWEPAPARDEPDARSDRRATVDRAPAARGVETGPRGGDRPAPPDVQPAAPTVPRLALDPRRAVESALVDPGPAPPPGPLDELRPRRPARTRSELRPDGPDGFTSDEGVFVARTARDGTVDFQDKRNLQIHIPLPTPKRLAQGLESWYDSLAPGRPRPGAVDRDERIATESGTGGLPVLSGGFDLTDGIMRSGGQDPYAARKIAFLDRTRDERQRLAVAARREGLREALRRTRADLERLWRAPGPAADKRHLVFLLWDECAERGPEEVVATARAVRGAILAFVRRRLPAGSPHAFGADELARENARRTSTERFDPYGR